MTKIKLMYDNLRSVVLSTVNTSKPYKITVGVHSPLLFIFVLDNIIKDLNTPFPWIFLFADNLALGDTDRVHFEARAQV